MAKKKKTNAVELANKKRHAALLKKLTGDKPLSQREIAELDAFENPVADNPAAKVQGKVFGTQTEAAIYAGVSTRTIRNWIKEGMPLAPGKKYAAVYLDAMKANDGSAANDIKDRKNEAEAENKTLKNELLKMQIAIQTGKLIAFDEVEAGRVERIYLVKTVLLGLSRKLGPLLKDKTTREMTAIIKREVEHCVNVFAGK